jgi:hypothetical protein
VFEHGVLRGVFGFKRDEVMRSGENYILRSLMTCTVHPVFLCVKIEKRYSGHVACMGRGVHRGLLGKSEGKGSLGNLGADGRIILRWIIKDWKLCV